MVALLFASIVVFYCSLSCKLYNILDGMFYLYIRMFYEDV